MHSHVKHSTDTILNSYAVLTNYLNNNAQLVIFGKLKKAKDAKYNLESNHLKTNFKFVLG